MQKRKLNQYKDGVLVFGVYAEKYNVSGELLQEKEFIKKGKLFFSYKSIREQDRLKFDDTGYKITLKINAPYMTLIKSNHVVIINNEKYSIKYIDPDINKRDLYMYLSNYEDEMSTYASIYRETKISPIKNVTLEQFKNIWCKVENISDKTTREKKSSDISKLVVQKKLTLKYIKELDSSISNDIISKYKIVINDIKYKIISALNIENEESLIQLEIEKEA